MMSFGPARRSVKEAKFGKETHGEPCREAHAGARYTSYTEKSLLVVKDYVYLEKNQNKEAPIFGAFHGMPDGVNAPRYMWDTATSLARRDNPKKKKQRTWLPNGGGMKLYNTTEAPKLPTEDCIIDMKTVKPKVDTWFRPKNKRSASPDGRTLNNLSTPRLSPPHSPKGASTVAGIPPKRENNDLPDWRSFARKRPASDKRSGDSAVKSLTSYWNDHLKRHPFTTSVSQISPKPEDHSGGRGTGDGWRKIPINSHGERSRPKSVESDGVVQEHTLVPSKVLADKKMSSVEDIMGFLKRSNVMSSQVQSETVACHGRGQRQPTKEPLAGYPASSEKKPISVPTPTPSLMVQPSEKTSSIDASKKSNDISRKSRRHNQHRHRFVVRLHTRWILAFKVLTLTFRPLIDAWKRRWQNEPIKSSAVTQPIQKYEPCQGDAQIGFSMTPAYYENPDKSQSSDPKLRRKDAAQVSHSLKVGRIKKLARRGMSNTLKFLSRARRRTLVNKEASKPPVSCFTVTNQIAPQGNSYVSFLTGGKPTIERIPIVTEPLVPSSSGPVVVYDEGKSSTAKSASLEVLPRGLRMSLYVEYQLIFSFIVVQSTLFLLALLLKWLQEYTA